MRRMKVFAAAVLAAGLLAGCGSPAGEELRLAGIQALDSGDYETAITSFDQALEKSRGKVSEFELDVLKYRAEAEYLVGDYEAAAHTYDVLIQVDEEIPEYLNKRCMSYAALGELGKAQEDYNRSYSLDKEGVGLESAMLTLTAAMEATDGYESQAMEIYQQLLADGKGNAEIYNRMGVNRMETGNYAEALDYFGQGIALGDETVMPDLLFNQAVAYEYQGDFSRARELFSQYVDRYGSNEEVERELAFLETR